MKNYIYLLLLLPLLYIGCKKENHCSKLADEPYIFPITPSHSQWNELISSKEMNKVVQIPDNILNCLSDRSLLETCINYPLYFEYTMGSSFNTSYAFDNMVDSFNGLKELFNRKSTQKLIIKRYLEDNIYDFAKIYGESKLLYFYHFLLYGDIILSFDKEQRFDFINTTIRRIELVENEDPHILCCNGIELTCYLIIAKALLVFNFEPFQSYVEEGGFITISNVPPNKVYEYGILYINQK